MTVTTAQATTLLENVLFESATLAAANAAQWVATSQTNSAAATVDGLAEVMAAAPEAGIAEQVVRYYEGALARTPSVSEIAFYVNFAEKGLSASQVAEGASGVSTATWSQIANYFAISPEFSHLTAGGTVIANLYQNILDRTPSADEAAFYQKALDGGTSVSTLLQYFVNSTEYQNKVNPGIVANLAATGEVILTGASVESAAGAVTVMANIIGRENLSGTATSALTVSETDLAAMTIDGTHFLSGALTITLTGALPSNSFSISDIHATSVTLNLSHFSGTSTPTYTLPAGTDDFTYDSMTFHLSVGIAPIELIGVSAGQITLLPAHA